MVVIEDEQLVFAWRRYNDEEITFEEAEKEIAQYIANREKLARIDELERLNMYYLRHDGEGEDKLAAQFDERIKQLKENKTNEE